MKNVKFAVDKVVNKINSLEFNDIDERYAYEELGEINYYYVSSSYGYPVCHGANIKTIQDGVMIEIDTAKSCVTGFNSEASFSAKYSNDDFNHWLINEAFPEVAYSWRK